jgi:hypothetical protein
MMTMLMTVCMDGILYFDMTKFLCFVSNNENLSISLKKKDLDAITLLQSIRLDFAHMYTYCQHEQSNDFFSML